MNADQAIAVCAEPAGDATAEREAMALAESLGLAKVDADVPPRTPLLLVVRPDRLEIRVMQGELAGGHAVSVDLLALDVTSPMGRRVRQPIAKAVGLPARKEAGLGPPTVIDATAGFGDDAWLLASLGCRVIAIERSPIMAALLRDGLRRAAQVQPDIAARIDLRLGDSAQLLAKLHPPDVVYLDPMFPTGRKTLERKPMRVLRTLVGPDDDAQTLFDAARATGVHRIVVKRPLRAPVLTPTTPTTTHKARGLRYDVYIQQPQRATGT